MTALILCLLCIHSTVHAQATTEDVNYTVPDDAIMTAPMKPGVINLTKPPYNMPSDGSTDVTEILQRAITENIGQPFKRKTFYFPNGTYVISNTLLWKKPNGKYYARLRFIGQSREKTIIKLADHAPGYDNPNKPKAMFKTGSINASSYDHYNNSFWNMTLDVGTGNPGAVALDYNANNEGSLRNLLVKSSDPDKAGTIGIMMVRAYPGPCLLKDVTVDGFKVGMKVRHHEYSVTMENITLTNQSMVAMKNMGNVVCISNLKSVNNVPVLHATSGYAMTTILGGQFSRPDGKTTTINAITNKGVLLMRDIDCQDYRLTVEDQTDQNNHLDLGKQLNYLSHPAVSLFDDPSQASWPQLKPTPTLPVFDVSKAVSVNAHGAKADDPGDDSDAIQAALDAVAENSDKTTVYFSPGIYIISKPLIVHGSIQYIEGFGTTIRPNKGQYLDKEAAVPIWHVKDMSVKELFFNDINNVKHWQKCKTGFGLLHDDPATLILTNIDFGGLLDGAYRSGEQAGDVYIENNVGSDWRFTKSNQHVYARQWNLEGAMRVDFKITSRNAHIAALGIKTERAVSIGDCIGGSLGIYGGLMYPVKTIPEENGPMVFKLQDTSAVINYAEVAYGKNRNYERHIVETRDDQTRTLTKEQCRKRNRDGRMLPLYVSQP